VGLEDPSLDATFFNAHVPNPHVQGFGGKGGKRERLQSHGTRVVPVYVLSLAGLPPGVGPGTCRFTRHRMPCDSINEAS
jgi:hypothetical protein